MDKFGDHLIFNVVPLVALIAASACLYFLRLRRGSRTEVRSARTEPERILAPYSEIATRSSSPRHGAFAQPIPQRCATAQDHTRGMDAWNNLQARLLAIVEQDERGRANIEDLDRAVADYDARRDAALGYGAA